MSVLPIGDLYTHTIVISTLASIVRSASTRHGYPPISRRVPDDSSGSASAVSNPRVRAGIGPNGVARCEAGLSVSISELSFCITIVLFGSCIGHRYRSVPSNSGRQRVFRRTNCRPDDRRLSTAPRVAGRLDEPVDGEASGVPTRARSGSD